VEPIAKLCRKGLELIHAEVEAAEEHGARGIERFQDLSRVEGRQAPGGSCFQHFRKRFVHCQRFPVECNVFCSSFSRLCSAAPWWGDGVDRAA
jgi:hypothetical protein